MTVQPSDQKTSWMDTPPLTPGIKHFTGELIASLPWLDTLSNPVQSYIAKLYGDPKQRSYRVKDFLNGVWFGHPLHPVLVTIPIGAWTTTLLLDMAWLADQNDATARSADLTLWLGLTAAFGAAATGATQWVDTDGAERRTGMMHALLNTVSTGANLLSGVLRLTGQRRSAIALATTSYLISSYAAYIGGELAYSNAIGVNHVAWEGGSDDYVVVMDEKDLQEGKLTRVDAAGIPAVLIKDKNAIYAIAATCSHLGAPLDEGRYEQGVVYCPWHNSGFRVSDGGVANSPAVCGQPTFAVRVRDGKIELRRLEHA